MTVPVPPRLIWASVHVGTSVYPWVLGVQRADRGSRALQNRSMHVGEAMKKQHSGQTIRPEEIDAEIAELRKIKEAVAELRSSGYRVDTSTGHDGRPQYTLRALNRATAKPNANTCRNHSWRPTKEGENCRLCIRQKKMQKRWETNRRALATIRRSSAKCSSSVLSW